MSDYIPDLSGVTVLINPTRRPIKAGFLDIKLQNKGIKDVRISSSRSEYIELIRSFMESEKQYLLVAGGDGTVHDAINTMMAYPEEIRKNKALGFFRGGSGNGYQDSYLIPFILDLQIDAFIDAIADSSSLAVDLIHYESGDTGGYCQLAGTGFDAHVLKIRESRKILWHKKKLITKPGMASYIRAIIATYLNPAPLNGLPLKLTMGKGRWLYSDSQINAAKHFQSVEMDIQPSLVEIGKRPYFARQFKICPDAVCNNGLLSLYLYNLHNRGKILFHFPDLWMGKHRAIIANHNRKGSKLPVEHYETSQIELSSPVEFPFHVDGELRLSSGSEARGHSLKLSVIKGALNFLVPPDFMQRFYYPSEKRFEKSSL